MQVNLPNSGGWAAVRQAPSGDTFWRSLTCIARDNNPSLGDFFDGAFVANCLHLNLLR